MSRKKLSPLVQAMNLFGQMDDRDKQTLADWVKSQTATPRKAATKRATKKPPDFGSTGSSLLTEVTKQEGSNAA